jgi:hypothetical protein
MICVITNIEEGDILCRYLSADVSDYEGRDVGTNDERATLVSDFGVHVEIQEYQFMAVQTGSSKATYEDGRTRKWQEYRHPNAIQPLAKQWWRKNYPNPDIRKG